MSDEVLEKLDGVKALGERLTHQDVELAGRRRAAHKRDVVAAATHGGPACGLRGRTSERYQDEGRSRIRPRKQERGAGYVLAP